MKARLPPSLFKVRRMISGSPASIAIPWSSSIAWTGCPAGSSISAETVALSCPDRTSPLSARDPSASPSASSRIDLPAPVSPVRTPSPGSNSSSSRSTSTTLWTASCLNMRRRHAAGASLARGRPLLSLLLFLDQQPQRLTVPKGAGIVAPKHCRGLVRLLRQTERQVRFDHPFKRFRGVAGGRIFVDHFAEPVGRGEPIARALVEAADLHLLAGEVVVDEVELQTRVRGIAGLGIAANQLTKRLRRL